MKKLKVKYILSSNDHIYDMLLIATDTNLVFFYLFS